MVAQRRREIAIRMAVGAQAGDVRRLVLTEAGASSSSGLWPDCPAAASDAEIQVRRDGIWRRSRSVCAR